MVESMRPERVMVYIRYFSVSALAYVFIMVGMYVLVDVLNIAKVASYLLVYATSYVVEYLMTLSFVFRKTHHWLKIIKLIIHTLVFLALGALVFDGLIKIDINYLVATLLTAIILLPVRFLSNRYLVYT